MKHRGIRTFLTISLALMIAFSFSSFVFADGWLSDVEGIELDTTYEGFSQYDQSEAFGFTVPAKGTINIHIESENYAPLVNDFYIYSSKNVDEYIHKMDYGYYDLKQSSARGVYYLDEKISLPKGNYYFVNLDGNDSGAYEFSLDYKANISGTRITNLIPKKKGFKVKIKRSGNATGYQIKYSTSKNMRNAKIVKTTRLYKTIRHLKKGKRYYVRVRAYRTVKVDGVNKTYYSKWSAKKKVKTK